MHSLTRLRDESYEDLQRRLVGGCAFGATDLDQVVDPISRIRGGRQLSLDYSCCCRTWYDAC